MGGIESVGHVLDGLEGAAGLDDGFATPRRPRRPDFVIHEHSGSHEGRIADPAGDLVTQPARRGAGAEVAGGIERGAVDRAVVVRDAKLLGSLGAGVLLKMLIIVKPVIVLVEILLPLEPRGAGLVSE